MQQQQHPSNKSLDEYYSLVSEEFEDQEYGTVEVVPVAETSIPFSIAEREAKDFRFHDRETRYQLETCLSFEFGSTQCVDVTVLNKNGGAGGSSGGLVDFTLSLHYDMVRSRDGIWLDCRSYRACYYEHSPGFFASNILGPYDCSLSDIETSYPEMKVDAAF